jgi:hypothetical protein
LDQKHRCEFAPGELVPDIRLGVHGADFGKLLDQLSLGHFPLLKLGLEQALDLGFPLIIRHLPLHWSEGPFSSGFASLEQGNGATDCIGA